jgi:hypothetical protein
MDNEGEAADRGKFMSTIAIILNNALTNNKLDKHVNRNVPYIASVSLSLRQKIIIKTIIESAVS